MPDDDCSRKMSHYSECSKGTRGCIEKHAAPLDNREYHLDELRYQAGRHRDNCGEMTRVFLAQAIRDAKDAGVSDADISAVVLEVSADGQPLLAIGVAP